MKLSLPFLYKKHRPSAMTSEEPFSVCILPSQFISGYYRSYRRNLFLPAMKLTNVGQPNHSEILKWYLHSGQASVEGVVKTAKVSQVDDVCYEQVSFFPVTFSPDHPLRSCLICNDVSNRHLEFLFPTRLSAIIQLQLCSVSPDAVNESTQTVVVAQKKQSAYTAVSKQSKIIRFEIKKGIHLNHIYE